MLVLTLMLTLLLPGRYEAAATDLLRGRQLDRMRSLPQVSLAGLSNSCLNFIYIPACNASFIMAWCHHPPDFRIIRLWLIALPCFPVSACFCLVWLVLGHVILILLICLVLSHVILFLPGFAGCDVG